MYQQDRHYMQIALSEAKRGLGYTSPNPMVGAAIVRDDRIIATGYHSRVGQAHAEVDALSKISIEEVDGATMYVTLEPCSHHGRTPPCVDAILKTGIKRVVIAALDPDLRVAGRGREQLVKAGIDVTVGICEADAIRLNSIYYFWKINKRPYIVMKAAVTLDGRIAAYTGSSKWISNQKSRDIVHRLRRRLKAIAIGKGTILADRPRLNCRIEGFEEKPVDKLIFSHSGDESLLSGFTDKPGKSYVLNSEISNSREKFIDFCNSREIDSVLVEGGAGLYTWFWENDLVDRLFLFYKTAFIGDDAKAIIGPRAVPGIDSLTELTVYKTELVDNNIMVDCGRGEALCLLDI